MNTTIANNIEIKNPTQQILDYCTTNLVMQNPHYNQNKALGFSTWGVNKQLYLYNYDLNSDTLELPFGLLRNIYPLIKAGEIDYKIKPVEAKKLLSHIVLTEYQKNAVETLLSAKNGVLVAPCGSGKTNIGLIVASELKTKVLWLTHTRELLKQSEQRARDIFVNIKDGDLGEITEGKVNVGEVMTFATVQTLSRIDLYKLQNTFGCIIVDESHRCCGTEQSATMFYNVVNKLTARYKFGLTATPKRQGGYEKTMFALLGDIAHKISDEEVAGRRIKARLKYIHCSTEDNNCIYTTPTKEEIANGKDRGRIDTTKLTTYLTTYAHRNDLIIHEIMHQHSLHKKQIVMSDRVKHCEELYERLKEYGTIKVALFVGKNKKDNTYIRKHYEEFDCIITTYAMSKEGLDMPKLDTLHLTTPKKDNQMIKQCVGRIERYSPNKDDALVIAYKDFNIRYCCRCCDNVRQALGIRKQGYDFSK